MKRYIFGVIFIILLTLGMLLFFVDGPKPQTQKDTKVEDNQKQTKSLTDYASSNTSRVVLTEQGEIVGDDSYKSIRITVSRDRRLVEVLDSYSLRVEKSQEFPNSQVAYETFLHALDKAGYTNSQGDTKSDERGVCPTGNRYVYEVVDGTEQVQRTWSTSCSAKHGTYAGTSITKQLFSNQITDYRKFVSDVRL
ncbi:hypothetical protein KA068_02225 [Candidatus Saccharibacteria bacterium]|nr:hypothetical protein [Candidatus Saccharibacteria bacterium]